MRRRGRPPVELTPGQRHAALAMSELGYGKIATAAAIGIDVRTLARLITVRDGHKGRPRGRPSKAVKSERNAEVARQRAEGQTLQAIADRHGITRERVRQIVRWTKLDRTTEPRL